MLEDQIYRDVGKTLGKLPETLTSVGERSLQMMHERPPRGEYVAFQDALSGRAKWDRYDARYARRRGKPLRPVNMGSLPGRIGILEETAPRFNIRAGRFISNEGDFIKFSKALEGVRVAIGPTDAEAAEIFEYHQGERPHNIMPLRVTIGHTEAEIDELDGMMHAGLTVRGARKEQHVFIIGG